MKRTQSYSSVSLYKKCPRLWEYRYVHGRKGLPNAASLRGVELHQSLENYFKGTDAYPHNRTLGPWRSFMEQLFLKNPSSEAEFAVTEDWIPCEFDTPGAYFRGAADLTYEEDGTVHILDWKSGREYPDHPAQGLTYAALYPEAAEAYETHFVYLDLPGYVVTKKYVLSDREAKISDIRETVEQISADTTYDPTPSRDSCQYCQLSWRKGGGCTRAP